MLRDRLDDPLQYWDFNVRGTINLLEIMEKNNCKKILFLAVSATVYGETRRNY